MHATAPIALCVGAGGWTWCHLAAHGPLPRARCPAGAISPRGPAVRPLRTSCHGHFPLAGRLVAEPRRSGMAPRAGAFSRLGAPDGLPAARTPRPPQRRDAAGPRGLFFRACSAPWAARLPAVLCVRGAGRCFQMTRLRVWPPRSCRSVSLRWSRRPQTPSLCLLSSSGLSGGVWSPARDSVTGMQARVPHLLPPYLSRAVGLCSTSPLGCAWRSWPRDAGGRARRRSRAAQGCATSMLNLLERTRFPVVLRISL